MNPRIKQTLTQGQATKKPAGPSPAELLAKMPRRPMSAEQQAAALEKVQQQATQRVKLGQQLFEAADAKLKEHQKVLDEINGQQQKLREQVQQDVAKSLQSYDQWMGKIDESFTDAINKLNARIDQLDLKVDASRGEFEAMIENAGKLLNQTQGLLAEVFEDVETEVAEAMHESVPEDQQMDIESLALPPIDSDEQDYDDDTEVLEVEILGSTSPGQPADPLPEDTADSDEPAGYPGNPGDTDGDDVFGEVLRRLRSQRDDDGNAAA